MAAALPSGSCRRVLRITIRRTRRAAILSSPRRYCAGYPLNWSAALGSSASMGTVARGLCRGSLSSVERRVTYPHGVVDEAQDQSSSSRHTCQVQRGSLMQFTFGRERSCQGFRSSDIGSPRGASSTRSAVIGCSHSETSQIAAKTAVPAQNSCHVAVLDSPAAY